MSRYLCAENVITQGKSGEAEEIDRPRAERLRGAVVLPNAMPEIRGNSFDGTREIPSAAVPGEEPEALHLSEGLETIARMAFMECGFREITIPYSVREIQKEAFWRCENLEKVTILNPGTKLGIKAFCGCNRLHEICGVGTVDPDQLFHLKGQPFLMQHLEDPANLDHQADPKFQLLTAECAKGSASAMFHLAKWFEKRSEEKGASQFYLRAANYWRYRAYCKGDFQAIAWFQKFFAEHPGEQLNSILYESSTYKVGFYIDSVPGALLNDLGYSFFDPDRSYVIQHFDEDALIVVSALAYYDPPDEDGFGASYEYRWWFLDDNFQPIPGVRDMTAARSEMNEPFFINVRNQAADILRQRKRADFENA